MSFSCDRHQLDPTKKLLIIHTSHLPLEDKPPGAQPSLELLALEAGPGLQPRAAYSPCPHRKPLRASSALTQGPFPLHLLLPRAEGFFSSPTELSQKQGAENPTHARSHFQHTPWLFSPDLLCCNCPRRI